MAKRVKEPLVLRVGGELVVLKEPCSRCDGGTRLTFRPDVHRTQVGPCLACQDGLVDTPRFWPASEYEPGHDQPSYDKQFVRNYLQALVDKEVWNKTSPAPSLPDNVIAGTVSRYYEALELITGKSFPEHGLPPQVG